MTDWEQLRKMNPAKGQGYPLDEGETVSRMVRLMGSARPSGDETEEEES